MEDLPHPASFRDRSGHIFIREDTLLRQINHSYKEDYNFLINSGLYKTLVEKGMLIPHREIDNISPKPEAYKIIQPEHVPFISYPYEWCFSMLKDAALLTLTIQKAAMEFGMSLKDASAYNIQFVNGMPVLIDTLSFERHEEASPWVAYRQFCQHFLAPLCLMKYIDARIGQLMRVHLDGIPLDLASALLPFRTKFKFSIYTHIHLHSKYQRAYADKSPDTKKTKMGRTALIGLIDSLESAIKGLEWNPPKTEWGDYYGFTNYSDDAFNLKKNMVEKYIDKINPSLVFDLGANTGEFSRLAGKKGIKVASFDIDPLAVEKNYLDCKSNSEKNILPLLLDLTNPSPALGWAHRERASFMERGPADMVLSLALIHHLAISNNLPFEKIAEFLSSLGKTLVIEFVPKDDPQVVRLLKTREDIFTDYNQKAFEKAFHRHFRILESSGIEASKRVLYLMEKDGA